MKEHNLEEYKKLFEIYDHNLSEEILSLFVKYKEELKQVSQLAYMFRMDKNCMLPDRTAETLYLLVRERKPDSIIEFSPHNGWTSFWMIQALLKNNKGHLYSFDIIPDAGEHLKQYSDIYHFTCGDVKKELSDELVKNCSFFYIDSEHTEEFAAWYKTKILDKKEKTNSTVIIDDIIHSNPGCWNSEADLIRGYLLEKNQKFCGFNRVRFGDKFDKLNYLTFDLPKGHHTDFSGELTTIFLTL